MNIKELKDRVLFALSVPKCVCCRKRLSYGEKALCHECFAELEDFSTRNCPKCSRVLNECDCSTAYLESHFVKRIIKCYRYINRKENSPANALIFSLKKDNREDVLSVCADRLEIAIKNAGIDPSEFIFINIPRRKAAILEYGIDHSALLAEELAKRFGAEYISLLRSKAKKPQKSLETMDRLKNADFELIKEIDLTCKKVIIVDDIITSGASMASAAAQVRSLGCKTIIAATLAVAYIDD